jgi:hypothetical protein
MGFGNSSTDTDSLNTIVAVIIGIAIATESLLEIVMTYGKWFNITCLSQLEVERQPAKQKALLAPLCVGVGITIGLAIFAKISDGVVLGGLGGLLAPFVHDLVSAGFYGKEIIKRNIAPRRNPNSNPAVPVAQGTAPGHK